MSYFKKFFFLTVLWFQFTPEAQIYDSSTALCILSSGTTRAIVFKCGSYLTH